MTRCTMKLTVSLLILLAVPVLASQVRQLSWENLIPETMEFDDPFEKLTPNQLADLGYIAKVRMKKTQGDINLSQAVIHEAEEIAEELTDSGIDIDYLLARREEITEMRRKRAESLVAELDGQRIRMPGYVLPLEYSGTRVIEFLLVPYVGACIHVPPPPPNQIVYVHVDDNKATESRGIFEPVWVTGEISVKSSTKNLFLVDGSSDIDIGYSMEASLVEPYTP